MFPITYIEGLNMIYYIIAFGFIAIDIWTKFLAENALKAIGTVPIINDILHLTYVENRGIAFGMFSGGRIYFVVISLIILALLSAVVLKTPKTSRTVWLKTATAFIYGGAIGNMIERIFKGYVVDFIDFRIIDFPVFNVADIAVCTGAAMLIIHFLIAEDKKGE